MDKPNTDLTRSTFLRDSGAAAAGAGAAALMLPGRAAAQPAARDRTLTDDALRAFDDDVRAAMATFSMVGAAVALFEGDEIVFNRDLDLLTTRRCARERAVALALFAGCRPLSSAGRPVAYVVSGPPLTATGSERYVAHH